MNSDLTFITNEKDKSLRDRFNVLIKDTKFFDILVGYFYSSGFFAIYKSLEKTKKIRILIGISTSRKTYDLIKEGQNSQAQFEFSHPEVKEKYSSRVVKEMNNSEDKQEIEEGIEKFISWIKNGKLTVRAYPTTKIHAKLYIMTFAETDRDVGRVITGSSNFTKAGLVDNLEFNVELKDRNDYEFAKERFEDLWQDAVDVSEDYVETIRKKTWLSDVVTPYKLYLKFLYEYFKDQLNQIKKELYVPVGYKKFEYQEQAVTNAKKILDEYGGVFISDVVGLGKTYISAMLAKELDGRNLVIAPPVLLEKDNPGSWPYVFEDFNIPATFRSIGELDKILKDDFSKYKNVFIDEAHRFRTETNITYEKLAEICRQKRVILVTATPYNNSPSDILSQIKLFQPERKSTIPNLPDIKTFFNRLQSETKNLDRLKDKEKYLQKSKEVANEIREKVLKYLMVRRTRTEIENYFKEDLKKQKVKFPEVKDPEAEFYKLNKEENEIFNQTIKLIAENFHYARYTPLLSKYYKGRIDQPTELAQENMGKFMKVLLVKRLESSFYAFRKTIGRFIYYYGKFIEELDKGHIYISKKYANKIFELADNDDFESIQGLIESGKAEAYPAKDFKKHFKDDLLSDLDTLNQIQNLWRKITKDPKFEELIHLFSTEKILQENKVIIFSESKETAEYLAKNLGKKYPSSVLLFTGQSGAKTREEVIENFDAKARFPKDEYRILVSTEVLSEGVNLHRSNIVINYDIPWNPTRMMQRVGRVNRIDTKFKEIYTYNFFPTEEANTEIKLEEAAEAKIQAFISLLGNDAKLLTEGESIESHEFFDRLTSKKTITGEDEDFEESELKYLKIIEEIRDKNPNLFEKIKRLPRKARTAKITMNQKGLLTYFRKGKLQKFFFTQKSKSEELDFITTAKTLEEKSEIKREKLPDDYFALLEKNKREFELATTEEIFETRLIGGRESSSQLLRILKAVKDLRQFTEEQEEFIKKVIERLEAGSIPRQTTKTVLKEINNLKGAVNPLKILAVLKKNISETFLKAHLSESSAQTEGPREVILSEYLT